jgi:hypothetical protein
MGQTKCRHCDGSGSYEAGVAQLTCPWCKGTGECEPKFAHTYCSQCGGEFGPGDHGFSHCENHQQYKPVQ